MSFLKSYSESAYVSLGLGIAFSWIYYYKNGFLVDFTQSYFLLGAGFFVVGLIQLALKIHYKKKG